MEDKEQQVVDLLRPIFPQFPKEVLCKSVSINKRRATTTEMILQRCVDDLLDRQTVGEERHEGIRSPDVVVIEPFKPHPPPPPQEPVLIDSQSDDSCGKDVRLLQPVCNTKGTGILSGRNSVEVVLSCEDTDNNISVLRTPLQNLDDISFKTSDHRTCNDLKEVTRRNLYDKQNTKTKELHDIFEEAYDWADHSLWEKWPDTPMDDVTASSGESKSVYIGQSETENSCQSCETNISSTLIHSSQTARPSVKTTSEILQPFWDDHINSAGKSLSGEKKVSSTSDISFACSPYVLDPFLENASDSSSPFLFGPKKDETVAKSFEINESTYSSATPANFDAQYDEALHSGMTVSPSYSENSAMGLGPTQVQYRRLSAAQHRRHGGFSPGANLKPTTNISNPATPSHTPSHIQSKKKKVPTATLR